MGKKYEVNEEDLIDLLKIIDRSSKSKNEYIQARVDGLKFALIKLRLPEENVPQPTKAMRDSEK